MIKQITIKQRRSKRVARVRSVIRGTEKRPRLAIFRSHTGLYGQLVDDGKRKTLGSVRQKGSNIASGALLGDSIVALCKEKKVKQLVFDRGGYKYHGVIKRIAEKVRERGVII